MHTLEIIILILLLLGIVDLVVGVSNDAVNFLNSAIGSRVSGKIVIYCIAGAGIVLGSLFSGGMMQFTDSGIFNSASLDVWHLLYLTCAIMLADIIIVDLFNTFGFPTSTTIALICETLGALAALFVFFDTGLPENVNDFINADYLFLVVAGIFVSIILSFLSGAVSQFFTRLIFSFNFQNKSKFLHAVFGALAFAVISSLVIKKDLLFANILSSSVSDFISLNSTILFVGLVCVLSLFFWLIKTLYMVNILKLVVLYGTFALALSFASNDLVNFIGPTLTGAKAMLGSSNISWNGDWDVVIFLFSGVVMMVTIFLSKKSRSVVNTEVYLGRQGNGHEYFKPSYMSRILVRNAYTGFNKAFMILPKRLRAFVLMRFKNEETNNEGSYAESFDSIRASVNLLIACLLITLGTITQFPLSTTIVVFMVSMGTSLADGAWHRESAVYRLSGVISILGAWFITAIGAFILGFALMFVFWALNLYALIILIPVVALVMFFTNRYHKRNRIQKIKEQEDAKQALISNINNLELYTSLQIKKHILESSKMYILSINGFVHDDLKQLREVDKRLKKQILNADNLRNELYSNFSNITAQEFDTGHYFVQALDYMDELSSCIEQLSTPMLAHVENRHKSLVESQVNDLLNLQDETISLFNYIVHIEKEMCFDGLGEVINKQKYISEMISQLRKDQLMRIMNGEGNNKSNVILLECYAETKNLLLSTVNLLKSHRDFYLKSISQKNK